MTPSSDNVDPAQALSAAQSVIEEDRHIAIGPRDIALLVLLWRYLEARGDAGFAITESEIRTVAGRLDSIIPSDIQGTEKRRTESLNRLIRAECLVRSDMSRLVTSDDTEYQVTALGESVATWHFEHSKFSGEPLAVILKAFNSQTLSISLEAGNIHDEQQWHTDVLLQIQVVLKDMLVNVQRHQRALDRQHQDLRNFIPSLLTESSEASITFCEEQLKQVLRTIGDLQEVTLASASTALSLINKIEDMGVSRGFHETEDVCNEIERLLNAVIQWTTQRATDWVEHHNVVHSFLRTVIYIDRQRRITEALKKSVALEPSWSLSFTDEPKLMRMREDYRYKSEPQKAPRKPKCDYSHEVVNIVLDGLRDQYSRFIEEYPIGAEMHMSDVLLTAHASGNAENRLVYHLPFLMENLLCRGELLSRERPWKRISETLEIEDLTVVKKR